MIARRIQEARELRRLYSACKTWLHETEQRVKLLDTRGEARLLKSDERLREAIKRVK